MRAIRNPENLRRERAVLAGNILLFGVFGLLLFGPLAFGAVEPWSIFLLEAGSAALLPVSYTHLDVYKRQAPVDISESFRGTEATQSRLSRDND